jgi:hypothetical protein
LFAALVLTIVFLFGFSSSLVANKLILFETSFAFSPPPSYDGGERRRGSFTSEVINVNDPDYDRNREGRGRSS